MIKKEYCAKNYLFFLKYFPKNPKFCFCHNRLHYERVLKIWHFHMFNITEIGQIYS